MTIIINSSQLQQFAYMTGQKAGSFSDDESDTDIDPFILFFQGNYI